jgi:transcriptional regulator with XRE-family HTH domain
MDQEAIYFMVGHRLKVALVEARMTQGDLAKRAGVTENTVSRHVNGKPMTLGVLYLYAAAIGTDPAALLPKWAPSDSNRQPTGYGFEPSEEVAAA